MNDALPHHAFVPVKASTDIRVILVGAQGSVMEAVEYALSQQPGLHVTLINSPEQAVQMIAVRGPVDVVLFDYSSFPTGGLDALQMLIEANGRGIAVIGHLASQVVHLVTELGAVSYLPTTMNFKSFVNTMRFVAAGDVFLPKEYLFIESKISGPELTLREYKVLLLLCAGRTDREISSLHNIPVTTVKMINKSIFLKLGAKTRTQAAVAAKRKRIC
jgi:two-component system, NarL family, nitrate/nitrite response regulator NarL